MVQILIKNAILVVLLIALFMILFSLFTFYLSVRPGKWPVEDYPENFNLEYANVTLKTADNLKLRGWFIKGKGDGTIIMMHGYPTNKADVLPLSLFLLERYNVLLFDFRSFGESEGRYTTVGAKEVRDLDAAVDYLTQRKDSGNIGAFGFSLGGAVALMSDNDKIKAVVSDSSYASLDNMIGSMYRHFSVLKHPFTYMTRLYSRIFFGIDPKSVSPESALKDSDKPVLLIHGEKDSQIPVKEAYSLHESGNNTKLWVARNAEHGHTYADNKQEYEKRVLEFFDKNLK